MKHSAAHHRRPPIPRVAALVLSSILLSISPILTTSAWAVDSVIALLGAGETLSTGTEATLTDPTATSVTVPVAGTVSIAEGSVTQTAPAGREFFGQEIDISAPLALTILDPIKMVFRFDTSVLPKGAIASEIRMFRNGTELPACTGAAGTASPDPCAASITIDATTGDLEIVALTTAASKWNAGKVKASDGGGSMTVTPTSVIASSSDNDLSFTFTASTGGMDGQIEMTIPSGWSAPQSTDAAAAGYVSVATGTCTAAPDTSLVSIAAMVVTLDMLCNYEKSFSIGYANAAAPTTFADHQFTTKTRLDGGTLSAIAVQPKVSTKAGPLAKFDVSAITSVAAGSAFTADVTAKDSLGNTITAYSGTPTVGHNLGSSTTGCGDAGGSPCDATASLGSFSSGRATLTATAFKAESSRKLTITDGTVASDSGTFGVGPAGTSTLQLTSATTATAGTAFSATVTAYDAYGNIATGYRGTVSFGSSDVHANLPADRAFSAADAGTATFSITLETAGAQSVSAKDTAAALTSTDSVDVSDTSVPAVTISDITPSLVKDGGSATITWSSNERGTYSVRVGGTSCADGVAISTGSYTSGSQTSSLAAADLAEGKNGIRVCLTDSGANTGGASGTITKDSVAPETTITSGPSGSVNTTSVTFGFSSPDAGAELSCRMTGTDGSNVFGPTACNDGTKTYDVSDLPDGTYTFAVTATDAAGNSDTTPATSAFTLDRSIPQSDRVVAELEAGETISTGTDPTASNVVVVSVRVPVAGTVTIEETTVTRSDPPGWDLFGQQVNITAPPAPSFDDPLRLVFRLALSALPQGSDAGDVKIFRDGSLVAACITPASDPCFTMILGTNSVDFTVLSTRASDWTFGVLEPALVDYTPIQLDPVKTEPTPTSPSPSPVEDDVEPPEVVWRQRGRYISPNGDGRRDDMRLTVIFSEPTTWDLSLEPVGSDVQQASDASVSASGSGTEVAAAWSELTAGRDVADGTYVWSLRGEDDAGNRFDPISGVVVVDRTSPALSNAPAHPLRLFPKERAMIDLTISEAAKIRVKVVRAGSVVMRFQRQILEDAGSITVDWEGRDNKGRFLRPAAYRLVIKAVDRAGMVMVNRGTRIYIRS